MWGENEKPLETYKLRTLIKEGTSFVHSPARVPEAKMAMMGVHVRGWIWASPWKRSLSSAIAYVTRDMENMVPSRLEEMMEAQVRTWRNRTDGRFSSLVYLRWSKTSLHLVSQITRDGLPEHLMVDGEKTLTLTWMKEHRMCQQPRRIWQGPTQYGEKPAVRGCKDESGSRAP